mmetsp:Transcript_35554/g.65187  ORF Transcript_35554/g.65187 Transcript_35554/m.65187 type:complete len:274 (-) Transcript_35554:375-1196(-)
MLQFVHLFVLDPYLAYIGVSNSLHFWADHNPKYALSWILYSHCKECWQSIADHLDIGRQSPLDKAVGMYLPLHRNLIHKRSGRLQYYLGRNKKLLPNSKFDQNNNRHHPYKVASNLERHFPHLFHNTLRKWMMEALHPVEAGATGHPNKAHRHSRIDHLNTPCPSLPDRLSDRNRRHCTNCSHKRNDWIRNNRNWCRTLRIGRRSRYQSIPILNSNPIFLSDRAANNYFWQPTWNFHRTDMATRWEELGGVGHPKRLCCRGCQRSRTVHQDIR